MSGQYATYFWLFVTICGFVVPLLLQTLYAKVVALPLLSVAAIGVLTGGLALRYVLIGAATYATFGFGALL